MMMASRMLLICFVAVATLGGCGEPTARTPKAGATSEANEATPTPTETSAESQASLDRRGYSCSGYPPAYPLADPYEPEEVPEEVWAAVEDVGPIDPGLTMPTPENSQAVELTETRVFFLTKERPYSYTVMEKGDKGWEWAGGGDCRLQAVAGPGLEPAEWWLPKAPDPDDTVLKAEAMQIACASGAKRKPEEFAAEVTENEEEIQVAMFVEPLEGNAFECPGNPSTPVTIELGEPVGDRRIVDVSVYPTRPVREKGPFGY